MTIYYQQHLKNYARKLRTQMTDAEQQLWSVIRKKQIEDIQFYRQRPIGKYIVDFISLRHKLVIEVDGSQHYEPVNRLKDQQRDASLDQLGYRVVRYNDNDVLNNIDGVIYDLCRVIKSLPTSL